MMFFCCFFPFLKLSRVPELKLVLMEITLVGVVWLQCFVVTLVLQSFDFLRIAQEVMKEDRSFIKVVKVAEDSEATWPCKALHCILKTLWHRTNVCKRHKDPKWKDPFSVPCGAPSCFVVTEEWTP